MPEPKPCTWIEQYADWAMTRSPLTPRHFHQNIALAMIAGAVAGRCYVQLPHEKVYPNLYTLVIATTSVYAKTTAFNIAQEVIDMSFPEKCLSGALTPEAMISELAGMPPINLKDLPKEDQEQWKASAKWGARRLFIADEAGRFFNTLKRDYNLGLDALMMELYDASGKPIARNTMKYGWINIKQPALSCLFGTTPANVRILLGSMDAWASGFWIRWNFVTETKPTPWLEGKLIDPPFEVVKAIRNVSHGWLEQWNAKPYSVPIDMEVVTAYNEATKIIRERILTCDDDKMHGALSRLPTKHLKAALLCAVIESDGTKPHLKLRHWKQAWELAQRWEADAEATVHAAQQTEQMDLERRVLELVVSEQAGGITSRAIQQRLHQSAKTIGGILEIFLKDGTIEGKPMAGCKTIGYFPTVSTLKEYHRLK